MTLLRSHHYTTAFRNQTLIIERAADWTGSIASRGFCINSEAQDRQNLIECRNSSNQIKSNQTSISQYLKPQIWHLEGHNLTCAYLKNLTLFISSISWTCCPSLLPLSLWKLQSTKIVAEQVAPNTKALGPDLSQCDTLRPTSIDKVRIFVINGTQQTNWISSHSLGRIR